MCICVFALDTVLEDLAWSERKTIIIAKLVHMGMFTQRNAFLNITGNVLCLFVGLCRGGRGGGGGRGGSRGGSRSYSRGGGYYGGGGSGYGGGGSAATIGIVLGIIGGIITLSVLICLCCVCCKRASRSKTSTGVVYSTPNRNTAGAANTNPNRTSGVSSNFNKTNTDTELRDCPPAYSTIDKPIYNVQSDMKTTQFNGYLPQTEVKTYSTSSAPKVHTPSSTKSYTTSIV